MIRNYVSGLLICFLQVLGAQNPLFVCSSKKEQTKKTACTIFVHKTASAEARSVAQVLAKDLSLTEYYAVQIKEDNNPFSEQMCKQVFDEEADFLIHVSQKKDKNWFAALFRSATTIEVLFVRADTGKVLFTKNIEPDPIERTVAVHECADAIIRFSLGLNPLFSSTLAWCEGSTLLLADPLGIVCKPIVTGSALVFAPTWHHKEPLLFYSQSAQAKHVLKSINVLTGESQVCVARKGLSMQLVYNSACDKSLMVASSGKGNSEVFLAEKNEQTGELETRPLTHNRGTNTSPLFLPNGNIVFCSDFETKSPQLYYLFSETKKVIRLTRGDGYCAAPSYCPALDSLVYTKPKNGIFQLYTLSLKGFDGQQLPKEVQLTFDRGNKTDPVCHPEGLLIAFVYEFMNTAGKKEIQIALLNRRSGAIHVITKGAEKKGFPAWVNKPWWYVKR